MFRFKSAWAEPQFQPLSHNICVCVCVLGAGFTRSAVQLLGLPGGGLQRSAWGLHRMARFVRAGRISDFRFLALLGAHSEGPMV